MSKQTKSVLMVAGAVSLTAVAGMAVGILLKHADEFESIAQKATKLADNTVERWCDRLDKKLKKKLEDDEFLEE